MTDVFNIFDGELDDEGGRPGSSWRRAVVGDKLGAEKLGASLYELEPGREDLPLPLRVRRGGVAARRRRPADAAGAGR